MRYAEMASDGRHVVDNWRTGRVLKSDVLFLLPGPARSHGRVTSEVPSTMPDALADRHDVPGHYPPVLRGGAGSAHGSRFLLESKLLFISSPLKKGV